MPELAEVETVRRVLKEDLIGLKITSIDLLYKPIFENYDKINNLIGKTFKDILRKGKYLIFVFEDSFLLSHLRMEGKYFFVLDDHNINKHMHVIFHLNNGYKLIYQDVRKFGRMHYYDNYEDLVNSLNLGVDANLAIDQIDDLYNKIKKSNKPLKTLLLDQSFIAGLGNIYVDEVLYQAKLLPNMPANIVSYEDLSNILKACQDILDLAIINKGTTIRSYTSSLGVEGNYQNYLKVHTKKYCPEGHEIITYKIGGRTTYLCPSCQVKKYVVGVTGSIATGKSNVVKELKEMGFITLDSDILVKEAYNDKDIINKILNTFNTIDKKELANIIYHNEVKKKELEAIIHPYVIAKLKEGIEKNNLIFLDIPLLFEANLEYLVDKIICCYCDEELELERLMYRNKIDKDSAKLMISNQMSIEKKKEKSHYVIDTSGTFKETKENIRKVIKELIYDIH